MKYIYLLFLSTLIVACNRPKHHYTLPELKQRRDKIEKYSLDHKNATIVFAKVHTKAELIKVIDDKWPDDTEYAYNVLKDSSDKVILIYSSPISESGDWDIEHKHYFESDGNTFLFERHASAFSDCLSDGEAAYETVKKYFDVDLKLIEQTDNLVDKRGNLLNKSKCTIDFAIEDATVYPNVEACLKAYKIVL